MYKILIIAGLAALLAGPAAAQSWDDNDDQGPPPWARQYRNWQANPWGGQRRHWQWKQARRDCYKYGDCQQLYAMRRDGLYHRQWRGNSYRRNGFTLQFGF